ncbi:MAG: hypothetical protein ACK40O_06860 [Allosphingosinicella sp.]
MAKPASKATVILDGGNLHFAQAGSYTIEYLPSGNVKIKVDGGKAHVLKAEEYAAITSFSFADGASIDGPVRVNGVTFHEADATGPFEISHNLNALIGEMISTHGVAWTMDNLVINGSKADTFKVVWDYLDDAYVAGNNYYDLNLNQNFVLLGVEYVEYLEAGGAPLTFVTAKYAADTNGNGIPQREQSMHDNLLGNVTTAAIQDRFPEPLESELLALVPDDYQNRPYYDGNEARVGGAIHDAVRAFDYDKGWDRPDWLDTTFNGNIDPLARDGGEMYYGDGNTIDDWNIVRHEGAGVELGLKIKHRGGDEYAEGLIDANGIAHYHVLSGTQPGNPGRAEWNFDFAATDFSPDDDFTYTLELDFDPGEGVQWVTLYSSAAPLDTSMGDGSTFQNSSNIAFYRNFIDSDPNVDGIQPYAFGEGTFNVRLSAYDASGGALIAQHEVVVHVPAAG